MKHAVRLFGLFIAITTLTVAQTRDLGAVKGQIQDSQRAAVRGAKVELRNTVTGFSRSQPTDAEGNYAFTGVPLTGSYILTVEAPNFHNIEQRDINLRADVTAVFNFTLTVAADAVNVDVYGTAAGLTTDSNEIGTHLDLAKIESTPILNNRLTSLQLLDSSVRLAQTTGDLFLNETLVAANGSGRRQTTYSIDNTTADDSWGRHTIFTALPFAAVQE